MEKKLIILILSSFLMFFNWFDPIIRESEKGEKAYNNRQYKEALKHFNSARDILSVYDSYKSEVSRIINKLEGVSSFIKKIKAEKLNVSEMNEKYKKQIISEFKLLSKGMNRFSDLTTRYLEKKNIDELKIFSKKIVDNVRELNENLISASGNKWSGDIGEIFKEIVYTKSQIELFNSKITETNAETKTNPDLEALRYNIASSFYELGDYKNAKNEFEKINSDKSNIKRSDLYFDIGNTYFKMKDYSRALELYKKSLRENPEDIEARQNYELTLEMLKKQKKDKKDNKEKKNNKDKNKDQKKDKKEDKPEDKKGNKKEDKPEDKKGNKKDKKDKENKDKENKDKENKDKDKDKNKEKKNKQNKPEDKKDKQDKKDEKQEEKKKQEKSKQKDAKPEQKHRDMLRFIDQNEKKQMKKMLQKNKLLKYGIKKSKKKRKDW